jgi:flagellar basal-body rod modification protein FlgD
MDVSASSFSASNKTGNDAKTTTPKSSTLDYNAFLQLLVAELQNQDPTQPSDPTAHVSQLASFSALEQQVKSNAKLDSLLTASALSQADSVIGHTITSADGNTTGKVVSVKIIDGGAIATLTDGSEVDLTSGITIA